MILSDRSNRLLSKTTFSRDFLASKYKNEASNDHDRFHNSLVYDRILFAGLDPQHFRLQHISIQSVPSWSHPQLGYQSAQGFTHTNITKMATVGMDVVLSVPNRFRFHPQSQPPAVVFYFKLPNGSATAVVGQQSGSGNFVCSSPISTNTQGHNHQGGPRLSRRVDLVQGDVYL